MTLATNHTANIFFVQMIMRYLLSPLRNIHIVSIVFVLYVGTTGVAFGQDESFIKVLARPSGDSIVLRWAPSTPQAWTLLNKHGYRIERYTLVQDGKVLDSKPQKILTSQPVKPHEQASWERYIDTDDFVAIAAQSIFGDSIVSDQDDNDIMQMIQKANEIELRFSYTLFAAEVSPRAALLSGLRFVDRDVKKNERYLYRVYPLVPQTLLPISFGYVYTGLEDYKPLPPPQAPTLLFNNKMVSITWPVTIFRDIYTSYFIEKSEDGGKTYLRINDIPHVPTFSEEEYGRNRNLTLSKMDSVKNYEALVYYRIVGVSSFGETGPPSTPASGKAVEPSQGTVTHVVGISTLDRKVNLKWEFPKDQERNISGFEIERHRAVEGKFTLLGKLSPQDRAFVDTKPLPVNYYRIVAIGKDKKRKTAFPVMVQLEDSIPPLAPQQVIAKIDTAGLVTLSWKANDEPDLRGYRVFSSRFANSEFRQVTRSAVASSQYIDTINIKTLTSKVYYKIAAVDLRYNMSTYSQAVEIVIPDILPPVPPVVKTVRATEKGIELGWVQSSSEDVVSYQLYRRVQNSKDWVLLKNFGTVDSVFIDEAEGIDVQVAYRIKAVDRHGLSSPFTPDVVTKPLIKQNIPTVKNLRSSADRSKKNVKLQWTDESLKASKYLIYRADAENQISLYRSIPAGERNFVDTNVRPNTKYVYRIKTVFSNGSESTFSEPVEVNY